MSEGQGFSLFGQPIRGRSCGHCKACCTQVPVELPEGPKPSNQRCQHLCSKGCSIYARRPMPCEVWSCRWLFDADTAEMKRPDLCGYIIDPMLDTILANGTPFEALQVWVDPQRRDAHKDPQLRAYLATLAERWGLPAIVRWGSTDGMLLVPPCLNEDHEWLEERGNQVSEADMHEKLDSLGAAQLKGRRIYRADR